MDHGANRIGIFRIIDPVQDHLGHRELTFDAFAARFEIKRFCQTAPLGAAFDKLLLRQPGLGIFHLGFGAGQKACHSVPGNRAQGAHFLVHQPVHRRIRYRRRRHRREGRGQCNPSHA